MEKPRILVLDPVCPKPYTTHTLLTEGLGGTEATILRVVTSLSSHALITVAQRGRRMSAFGASIEFVGADSRLTRDQRYHSIVVLRSYTHAVALAKQHPKSKVYLWLHDMPGEHDRYFNAAVRKANVTVLAVSKFHKTQLVECWRAVTPQDEIPTCYVVYNPIGQDLDTEVGQEFDKDKLCFFSSPHKGLEQTLELFKNALNFNPNFKLYVANPGYFPDYHSLNHKSITNIGSVPHEAIMQHVRGSLCVFYPNYVYPETFGLVYAEANAVGTPVLTHDIGAASEVLLDKRQIIDCRNPNLVLDTLMRWYKGDRPKVYANEKFRIDTVTDSWLNILKLGV